MTQLGKFGHIMGSMSSAIGDYFNQSLDKSGVSPVPPCSTKKSMKSMSDGNTIYQIISNSRYVHDEMGFEIIDDFDGLDFEDK